MNFSNELIFLVIGLISGLAIGALIVFLLVGKKSAANSIDVAKREELAKQLELAKQEYENNLLRLRAELTQTNQTIESNKRALAEKDNQAIELSRKYNEVNQNYGIAAERAKSLAAGDESNLIKIDQQENELLKLRETATQLSSRLQSSEERLSEQTNQNKIKDIQMSELVDLNSRLKSGNATLTANLTFAEEKTAAQYDQIGDLTGKNAHQNIELTAAREEVINLTSQNQILENKFKDQLAQSNLKEVQISNLTELYDQLRASNASLSTNLLIAEERLVTQKTEIEDIREKSHLEFENIANRLLESKSEKFTETNRTSIEQLLEPLGKEINSFKLKVEETYDKESKERFSLGEKVRELIATTDKVSAEANNLATALKGQSKTQGNWGEMILERILETNGLVRGREYDVQHPMKNSEGDQQYLDVIVHLPDNRKLIIDSKVTLNYYDRYCASENDQDREKFLKDHHKALSTHIDQLSGKKYHELETSPDFVMLFVPIEPAYLTALQYDTELWSRAYAKQVLLISPTNLMGAVKMVADLWKRDKQSKNALQIAEQGEKLYDKFIGFLNNMDDIGSHIIKTQDAYNRALGQLKQGRGNLIGQAEKLKNLGIKSNKQIPGSMLNYDAAFDDDLAHDLVSDEVAL